MISDPMKSIGRIYKNTVDRIVEDKMYMGYMIPVFSKLLVMVNATGEG
jgi:hypothetical protein